MRIPRYRSNVQMTTEAPGRPMTARMRAAPMVNAIEAKANVFNAALEQVNEYAVQRQKMINETKRNEAIFGAKEGLLLLVDRLEADKNPFDIINMDNKTGRWFDEVKKIKSEMRSKVTQTDAELAYFDQQFTQNEISLRFQLKDRLDTAIETRAKAAVQSRNQQYIDKYSNPNVDFTLFNEESSEIGAMLNQSVKSGYMAPELIDALGRDTVNDIMKNLVTAYAGNDPNLVYNLKNYLDVLDKYAGVTDETFEGKAKLIERDQELAAINLPNSDWTKIVLGSVNRSEARDALATTMTKANKFDARLTKQLNKQSELTSNQFKNLKLLAFSADLSLDRNQNIEELKGKYGLIFTVPFMKKLEAEADSRGNIGGNEFQDLLLDFLTLNNQLTITEQADLESKILQQDSIFSTQDDPRVVDLLSKKVIADDEDTEYLEANIHRLTRETYIKFAADLEKIGTDQDAETKDAFNLVMNYVKFELNMPDKDELTNVERVSMQSTNAVKAQLLRDVFKEDSKLTDYNSIVKQADKLIAVEKENVKRALLPLFGNFLEEINANEKFRGSISATSTDPGKDLEDRLLSLSAEDQNLVAGLYYQYQGRLNTFIVRGFFE